jgi:hypothetical protein
MAPWLAIARETSRTAAAPHERPAVRREEIRFIIVKAPWFFVESTYVTQLLGT